MALLEKTQSSMCSAESKYGEEEREKEEEQEEQEEQDRVQAPDTVTEMTENGENVIFTDASAKDSNLGAAVVMPYHSSGQQRTWQMGIGPASHRAVHAAELIAICQATGDCILRESAQVDPGIELNR
jgi:hypothetical protein